MTPETDSRSDYQSSGGTTVGTPSDIGDTGAIIRNSEQRLVLILVMVNSNFI